MLKKHGFLVYWGVLLISQLAGVTQIEICDEKPLIVIFCVTKAHDQHTALLLMN